MLQALPSSSYSETERIKIARPNHPAPIIAPQSEVLITWDANTEIRPGDLVLVEHSAYGRPSTDCLEAFKRDGQLYLATCEGEPIPIRPGAKAIYRNGLWIKIKGIARGSYLAF